MFASSQIAAATPRAPVELDAFALLEAQCAQCRPLLACGEGHMQRAHTHLICRQAGSSSSSRSSKERNKQQQYVSDTNLVFPAARSGSGCDGGTTKASPYAELQKPQTIKV
jgi:hypothetical protein